MSWNGWHRVEPGSLARLRPDVVDLSRPEHLHAKERPLSGKCKVGLSDMNEGAKPSKKAASLSTALKGIESSFWQIVVKGGARDAQTLGNGRNA